MQQNFAGKLHFVIEWFSSVCHKTKTNESNHSGKSQSQTTHNIVLDQPINNVITCTIVPDTKHGKTGESELHVYLVFGCTSDGMKMWFKFLGQSGGLVDAKAVN